MNVTKRKRGSTNTSRLRAGAAIGVLLLCATAVSGQCWEAELIPADAQYHDIFGWNVGLSADGRLLAGTTHRRCPIDRQAVYIFEKIGDLWYELSKIDMTIHGTLFHPVAVHPAGREIASIQSGEHSQHQVVVYRRQGDDWVEHDRLGVVPAKISCASLSYSDDGSTLVYGGGADMGEIHVFRAHGDSYLREAIIVGDDLSNKNRLGHPVALSSDGNTIVAGAWVDNGSLGSAHVYRFEAGIWSRDQELHYPGAGASYHYGKSVALTGDGLRAFVGSREDSDGPNERRVVYQFDRIQGQWVPSDTIVAPEAGRSGYGDFVRCSADGSVLIVADPSNSEAAPFAGAVYIYRRTAKGYLLMRKLILDNASPFDSLGCPIDLTPNGMTLIASTPFGPSNDPDPDMFGTGAVYVLNVDECAPDLFSLGDLNRDGRIDELDLAILLDAYKLTDEGDVNGDGVTDHTDLATLLSNWGLGV